MSNESDITGEEPQLEHGELLEPEDAPPPDASREAIEQPAKVMRVGAMMRQLLEELRNVETDVASRDRMKEIYETSIDELGSALSPDLHDELRRLSSPFSDNDTPSDAELHVAKAQLVGWLEGLVQGIQATLFAQQMAAQAQLQNMRGELGTPAPQSTPPPGGTYL